MHSFGETQQPPDGISGSTSQDMKHRFLQRMFYLFFFLKKTKHLHKHGTCSVNCVRWSSFDELQKNKKKQKGKKKIETFVQTVATMLPLIARSTGAPESRSDCLEFKRRRTFQNFTASKLQGKKKKDVRGPV